MMKIADSVQQCNPEQIQANMNSMVEELKTTVQSAAASADSFDSVERKVLLSVLQLGYQALELLLSLQGDGDLGEQIETTDDKIIKRSQTKSITKLRSIFGEHSFEQITSRRARTNRSICVRSVPVCRCPLPAGRFCCKSSPRCLALIKLTTKRCKTSARFSATTSASIQPSESTETWDATPANFLVIFRCQSREAKEN
ncbi:hypothetical protein Poly41_67150 [Novipirellula artificiosorum]|uniref:Uncharacterized protein n=1 Tax=Novipirellula artificiosorum TaxID=2528016 RepID=A0A5C6CVZ8_9BACT|nr:hypothetical protein Poly41_67150 [Novipirellula artificiosorum]